MRSVTQHWYVYSSSGQTAFICGPQEHEAHQTKRIYQTIYPEKGPFFIVVYLVNKVDGSLVAGTLDIFLEQRVHNYEAS